MFKIIKKGSGNFWHNFNNGSKEVNLSDWEIVLDSVNQTVSLQMLNGANVPNNSVIISDVVVIDETDGSIEETFGSVSILRTRLIELNYTPYIVLNGFVPEAPIDGQTYGRKDAEWVEVSGGGSVGTLQQVTDNGYITTNPLISTNKIGIEAVASGGKTQNIVPVTGISDNQNFTLPNREGGGAIALISDIPPSITIDATPTDGSSNAVSSNGVFDGLALKQDFATATTGAVISFAVPQVYNSVASPTSSNITNDLTGARIGVIQKIYHNNSSAPTFPAGWVKLSGTYTNSVTNIIYAEWCEGSRVEYWIVEA